VTTRLGFRGRLVAAAAIVSLVTLGAAFGVVSILVNRSQQRQLDDALRGVAAEEAEELSRTSGGLHVSDRPGPAANDVGPLPKFGVIYAPSGVVLSATENLRGHPPALAGLVSDDWRGFDLWVGDEHLRGMLVSIPNRPGFRVLMAASRGDLDGDAAFLTRAMLAVFAFAVAWTVALAVAIVGRLTRHHRIIARTAQRVAGGDLSARVGALGGRDDVAELGHNVDAMIDRLALLLTGQQQFIAHAAHELRSPLAALYGELSHALRRSRSAEEYRSAIEEALGSTRTLKSLAEDLLSLARLGAEQGADNENVELDSVLKYALAAVSPEQTAKDVRIEVTCPPVLITGRPGDLARMFRNLLENAIRHAPAGSGVQIRVLPGPANVDVEIRDSGAGVPDADRERVFDPFFRGSVVRAGNHPGAGLGLTIARDIARLHGGDIALAVTAGQSGARFVVRLPRAIGSPEGSSHQATSMAVRHTGSG
jgi:two-component system OmpR family sensor kinase